MLDRLALHATVLKADQAIGHGRQRGVVGDDDDRNALLAAGILQQLQDLLTGFIVERARGLVAQEQLGVLCQCTGNGHALLLAARKLRGEVGEALTQANLAKRLLGIERIGADLRRELDVFERRQVGDQIVELEDKADVGAAVFHELLLVSRTHVAPVHRYGAGGYRVHTAQDVERRGLAGTRGAQDNGELTALNGKARAVERMDTGVALAVCFDDVFEFDISHRLIPIWSDNSLVLPISHRPKRDRFILAGFIWGNGSYR